MEEMMKRIFYFFFTVLVFCNIPMVCDAGNLGDFLRSGQVMKKDDFLMSPNGRYILIMQIDGNLVLYRLADGKVVYSMEKYGEYAVMQDDGNFVEYASNGRWLWATHTNTSYPGTRIATLLNDGSFIIGSLGPYVTVYWSSGPDTDASAGANRYPMVVNNLGAPPSIPIIPSYSDDYWATPGLVIIK